MFNDFSVDSDHVNLYTTIAAMCLLCHDPMDQRIKAALHIFQNSRKAIDQFTHNDMVQLFMSAITLYTIENSFELEEDDLDDMESNHIHLKRRLSHDDSSYYNVVYASGIDV